MSDLDGQREDDFSDELVAALESIRSTRGLPFLHRLMRIGLNPKTDLAGGDWRNCDFSHGDLTDADFRNSRLFHANFRNASVSGADFRGAGDVHTAGIHLSSGWRDATFDDYQLVLIQAQIERMRAYQLAQPLPRLEEMSEKDWFFAVKACPSFSEARDVLREMEAAGHPLNPYAYSYVLDRAKRDRDADGWELFEHFIAAGGHPDGALYTAGIGVSPDSDSALALFNAMKAEFAQRGLIPDERAYNMVISKQTANFTVALGLFHDMKRKGLRVGPHTVYALFDACRDFADAVRVLIEARASGVDINDASFLEELANAGRYADINQSSIRVWQSEGLSPDRIIGRLVNQALRDPFRRDALSALGHSTE